MARMSTWAELDHQKPIASVAIYEAGGAQVRPADALCDRACSQAGEWVCSQAQGDALEIAVGTGRNLRHLPDGSS